MCKAILKQVLYKLSPRKNKRVVKPTILEIEKMKENYNMPNEEQIKNAQVEETEKKVADNATETSKEEAAPVKEEEKVEEKTAEVKEQDGEVEKKEEEVTEQDEQPKVEEVEDTTPNAIRVEDLVTKADLQEMLSAFNAKLDAIIKENQDLKDENSKLHDKYEVGDFGNEVKQGTMPVSKPTQYQSFDEYSKQFM